MKSILTPLASLALCAFALLALSGCKSAAQIGPVAATVGFDINGKPVTIDGSLATNGILTLGGSATLGSNTVGGQIAIPTK